MSLAVINSTQFNETNGLDNHPVIADHRRNVIKRKVLAIGKMSRNYTVLKEHPDLVKQLKSLRSNGKLPLGVLSSGEQGLREAIISASSMK